MYFDDQLPTIFEALGDTTRFKIFSLVCQNRKLCVTDIASILKLSLPATSYHLKILELSGVVFPKRNGQMVCYQLVNKNPAVKTIARFVKKQIVPEVAGAWPRRRVGIIQVFQEVK